LTSFELWLFYLGKRVPITNQRENWVSSATSSGQVEKKKVPPSAENLNADIEPIASHFTDEEYGKLFN
jgi:hypothetical protein